MKGPTPLFVGPDLARPSRKKRPERVGGTTKTGRDGPGLWERALWRRAGPIETGRSDPVPVLVRREP